MTIIKGMKTKSGFCVRCGIYRDRLQRDRIVPGFLGGKYTASNIQFLCPNCHEEKTFNESSDLRARASVRMQRGGSVRAKITAALRTPETRARLSLAGKRYYEDPEEREKARTHLAKFRAANIAALRSPEARAKASLSHKGLPSPMRGKKHTPESKLKLSLSHLGNRHSEASKRKMSETRRGRKLSAEHVAKIAAANRGVKRSEETRAKLRAAWVRRKGAVA